MTGDTEIVDPVLQCFRVIESLAFDRKRLKAILRARRIGQVEVKTREKTINANQLQREFAGDGDQRATLIITRLSGQTWVVLAERLKSP